MRAREYLLEYNRQKTEQNYGDKIVMIARRDPTIPQEVRKQADNAQLADIVLSQLEKADPTRNKEYTQGLAKLYANGGLKMEDASSTLADYLTKFHKLKVKRMIPSPRNDFLRYTSVGDFMSVVDEYPDPDADTKQVNKGKAWEYYSDEDVRIVVPETEEAACYYGQGTRWCTAAKGNNMFDTYNEDGPMYIILPKHPKHTGEKYQLHFESMQFMDEKDHNISVAALVERFPGLTKAFEKQGKDFGIISFLTREDRAKLGEQGQAYLKAHGRNQGNGVVTISLNDPSSDIYDFYVNSRVSNLINAYSSRYDWNIPSSEPGDRFYTAYAVIDLNRIPEDAWIVVLEIDYNGHGTTQFGKYYSSGGYSEPLPPGTARDCVNEISDLLEEMANGEQDASDNGQVSNAAFTMLKQKYGA